jgi:transcriptional regulator with XRE-family HTH domain
MLMPSQLHERIRATRRAAGLTQEKLGELLDVSKAAVAQWESKNPEKRTKPTHANMVGIHHHTDASMDWLINDESDLVNIYRSETKSTTPDSNTRRVISPHARRLISRIETAESSGSSSPQLLAALEAVLDLAQPVATKDGYKGLDDLPAE